MVFCTSESDVEWHCDGLVVLVVAQQAVAVAVAFACDMRDTELRSVSRPPARPAHTERIEH